MNVGTCPICKLELEENDGGIKFCPVCRRDFWPVKTDVIDPVQYDDIESLSDSGAGASPILICDESDNSNSRFYNAEYRKRKQSYLQKYFPNATITSLEYIPT